MSTRTPMLSRGLAMALALALEATGPGAAGLVLFGVTVSRAEEGTAQPGGPAAGPVAPQQPAKPGDPAAQPGPLDAFQVMEFLNAQGIFKGPDDPLRSYMLEGGKVSAMGDAAYRYFLARPKEVQAFAPAFDKLRESGPLNDKKAQQIQQALQTFNANFGGGGQGAGSEDAYSLGAKLNTLLTGASEVQPNAADDASPKYTQVEVPDGFNFYDKDGLLVKMTKARLSPDGRARYRALMAAVGQPVAEDAPIDAQAAMGVLQAAGDISGPQDPRVKKYFTEGGTQVWNRQIEQQQKMMNAGRPPQAPPVPVNGRYNYEMFQWSYWTMHQQVEETKQQLRVDRLARIAELLGKQFRDDQWYKDPKIEKTLLDEARKKTFSQMWLLNRGAQFDKACGRKVANYLDLIDCKLERRVAVVGQLEEKLQRYLSKVEEFKDLSLITQDQFNSVSKGELLVRKYVTLSWIEQQRWRADAQIERLDFKAPDHALIKKSIDDSPLSKTEKADYEKRGTEIEARIKRLQQAYKQLEDTLNGADYATGLERIQAMLMQTNKELGDAELDFMLYATMPSMAKSAKDESSGWINGAWKGASEGMNWTSKKVWNGDLQGEYLRNRSALGGYSGSFDQVTRLIAQGKWDEARAAMIAADPKAIQTHGRDLSLRAGELGDADRIQAVLKKAGESVQSVSNQHFWVRVVGDFIIWSVATAVLAPVAGALLSGMSRGVLAGATAAARGGMVARVGSAWVLKPLGEILEHSAFRLAALSPTASKVKSAYPLISRFGISGAPIRLLDATAKRAIVAGSRIGAFAGMSGGISGGFTAATHLYNGAWGAGRALKDGDGAKAALDQFWSGGESAFANPLEAAGMGAKHGVSWAVGAENGQWWTPLLGLGFGIPSSVVEGRKVLGPVAENLASRGTLGLGAKVIETGSRGWLAPSTWLDRSLQGAVKAGGARATGATLFGLADNISKYMLFSQGIGQVAHFASWQLNQSDADNLERRIKKANQAEMNAMMAPYWLMLPVFPARFEVQSAMQARQRQGYLELQKSGELDLAANAAEGQTAYLRGKQEVPLIQRIFQFNPWAEEGNFGSYTFTKDMKYDAIREILPSEITGKSARDPVTGKSLVDPLSVNPLEYLRVAQMEPKPGEITKVGRLHIGDEVRDQAAALFEQSVGRNPQLAGRIIDAHNLGQKIDGFGYVRPEHAEEVARVLYRTAKEAGMTGDKIVPDPAESGGAKAGGTEPLTSAQRKALAELLPAARERLAPYLASETKVRDAGGVLIEKLSRNKTPSAELKSMVDAMLKRTGEWSDRFDAKGNPDFHKPWTELVKEFRTDAQWQQSLQKLSPIEREVITSSFDYLEAIHARFNTFNKVGVTHGRMEELLRARSLEAHDSGNRTLGRGVDKLLTELGAWRKGEGNLDAPVQEQGATMVNDPAKPGKTTSSYNSMLFKMDKALEADAAMSAADRSTLKGLIKELEAAPWLLHDSKGSALPGWRPGQFEALLSFLSEMQSGGANAVDVIRVFQLLKTGGGKTMLAYEGILPLAEADAAIHGKKMMFLTVLSNLEAQARMEFRAYRKLNSDLTIDTFENFKTKIATGKTQGKEWADDYWIILDEMDGAALQPALTIGETTAYVSKEHPAYKHLQGGLDRIDRLLSGDSLAIAQKLRFEANRQKGLIERVAETDPYLATALREGADKLLRIGERLGKSNNADLARVRSEVEGILRDQKGVLKASADFGAGTPGFADAQMALVKLATEVGEAKTAKGLGQKLDAVETQLALQLKELADPDAAGSAQMRTLRPQLEALRQELAGLRQGLGSKPAKGAPAPKGPGVQERARTASESIRRFHAEEQSVLRAGSKQPSEYIEQFKDAASLMREAAGGKIEQVRRPDGMVDRLRRRFQGETTVEQGELVGQIKKVLNEQSNVLWRARWKSGDGESDSAMQALASEARAKRARADALRPMNRGEAANLDAEVARLDAKLSALESRSKGMAWLEENGQAILREAESAKPGWEGRVRELTDIRRSVLETALDAENPIYSLFAQMKEKMYPLYASKLRVQEDGEMLMVGAWRLDEAVAKQREAFVNKLQELVERYEGRSDPLSREAAGKARELLQKAQTEFAQVRDARAVSKALDAKEPAGVKEARSKFEGSSAEVSRMDRKVAEAVAKLDGLLKEGVRIRAEAELKPKQAAELLKNAVETDGKAATAKVEVEAFKREVQLKNDVARDQFASFRTEYERFLKGAMPEVVKSFEKGSADNVVAWEAELKAKGFDAQAAQPLWSELGTRQQFWKSEQLRLTMDSKAGLKAQFERIDGVGTSELALRTLLKYTGAQWAMSKVPGVKNLSIAKPITETTVGLTRTYADKLMRAVLNDPFLTPTQRWTLFWNIVPSSIWPRGLHFHAAGVPGAGLLVQGVDKVLGIQPSGETWVRRELFNLARGNTDDPGTVRYDNITKKMNAVHNGQWFETMDTPTRRFWELEYGADLTLPYEHKAIVTMNDFVRDNKNVRIVGMSGTAGPEFRRYLEDGNVRLSGKRLASTGAADISLDIYGGPSGKFQAILDAVRGTKEVGGLVVLSLPDTRSLKLVREVLMRQGLKENQIAQVFSDSELLRVNNPAANVSKQTNLHGLNDGTVKVLMLDTRVGGRGLDLNFKGIRGGSDVNAFRGYNKMIMLMVDPQNMTAVHNIQAQGRIDLGRVNPGTERTFHLVLDARTAQKDPVFMEMMTAEPRFAALRRDPAVRAIAAGNGRNDPEWVDIHQYIQALEAKGERPDISIAYRDLVKEYLTKKQSDVEIDQLRSASVKQDRPKDNPLLRGLEGWAR